MITAQEYLENNDLLEVYYLTSDKYLDLAQEIIKQATEEVNGMKYLNYAVIGIIVPMLFLSTTSNIDVVSKDVETELTGYDVLKLNREVDNIINKYRDRYNDFVDIVNNEIKMFEQRNINTYSVINNFLDQAIEFIKGLNEDQVGSFLNAIGGSNDKQ